ncbi:MAG: hypothetical protein N4A31_01695 [Rickettsiales bacterium]|nr:hypothetical protein [Rickettsiales bacterium]
MKSSTSDTNLTQKVAPPSRTVTYSNSRNELGEFIRLIEMPDGNYVSEGVFYTLSPNTTPSSPIGLKIDDPENIEEGNENNIIIISYPNSTSVGDIFHNIQEQQLATMQPDHKAMKWDDSF